ncbi:MAG: hypothetical protein ACI92S_003620, partial [Planctomycetaceae bacterium]
TLPIYGVNFPVASPANKKAASSMSWPLFRLLIVRQEQRFYSA